MGNSGQLPVWVTLKLEQKQLLVMGEIVLSDVAFSMGRIEPLDIGKCHLGYLALRNDDPGNTFFLPVAPFKLKPLDNFRLLQVGTVLGLNRDARALRIFEIHQKVAGQYLRGTLVTTVGQAKLLGDAHRIFDPHRKLFTDIGDMGRPIQGQEDGQFKIG